MPARTIWKRSQSSKAKKPIIHTANVPRLALLLEGTSNPRPNPNAILAINEFTSAPQQGASPPPPPWSPITPPAPAAAGPSPSDRAPPWSPITPTLPQSTSIRGLASRGPAIAAAAAPPAPPLPGFAILSQVADQRWKDVHASHNRAAPSFPLKHLRYQHQFQAGFEELPVHFVGNGNAGPFPVMRGGTAVRGGLLDGGSALSPAGVRVAPVMNRSFWEVVM